MNGAALTLLFTPGSQRIVIGDSGGNVLLADVNAPDQVEPLQPTAPAVALAVSPDGARLAAGGVAGNVELWNLTDGSPAGSIQVPGPIRGLSFGTEGRHLLVQTVSWLHRVSLTGPAPELAESRLAPLGAATRIAHRGPGSRTLRALVARPRLAFKDLDMGRPNAVPIEGALGDLRGHWQRAVGLTLDQDGLLQPLSSVPLSGPGGDTDSVN